MSGYDVPMYNVCMHASKILWRRSSTITQIMAHVKPSDRRLSTLSTPTSIHEADKPYTSLMGRDLGSRVTTSPISSALLTCCTVAPHYVTTMSIFRAMESMVMIQ
jgi:hypothetical protein